MNSSSSPQHLAVGEVHNVQQNAPNEIKKQSYASTILAKQSAPANLELFQVVVNQGEPVIQFTKDEVNNFIREEGLHQAVVIKFSYGRPDLSEVRRIFSSQFDVQGHCNIGHLEYRHLLVRFDLHNDYVQFLLKSAAYPKSKRNEYFFRTFPWSLEFNPKEETPMAVVWISLPGLPPNFFAKRSLMSIASSVGKPLSVDKATHDRSRPSAARVKVIINLLDNHPKKVKLQIVDRITGKTVEFYQQIVIDNLPKYCTYCQHQGHDIKVCRIKKEKCVAEVMIEAQLDCTFTVQEVLEVGKLKGDARDYLNAKRVAQTVKESQDKIGKEGADLTKTSVQNEVMQNADNAKSGLVVKDTNESYVLENNPTAAYVESQELPNQIENVDHSCNVPMQPVRSTVQNDQNLSIPNADLVVKDTNESSVLEIHPTDAYVEAQDMTKQIATEMKVKEWDHSIGKSFDAADCLAVKDKNVLETHPTDGYVESQDLTKQTISEMQVKEGEHSKLIASAAALTKEVQLKVDTVSLNELNDADFELSISLSTQEKGTVSGVKNVIDQQNSIKFGNFDEARLVSVIKSKQERMNQMKKGEGMHRNDMVAEVSNAQNIIVPGKLIDALDKNAYDGQNHTSKGHHLGTHTSYSDTQNGHHISCKMQQIRSCYSDSDTNVEVAKHSSESKDDHALLITEPAQMVINNVDEDGTNQIKLVASTQDGQLLSSEQQQGINPASNSHTKASSAVGYTPTTQLCQVNPKPSGTNLTDDHNTLGNSMELADNKEEALIKSVVKVNKGSQLNDTTTLSSLVSNCLQEKAATTPDQYSSIKSNKAATVLIKNKQIAEENTDISLRSKTSALVAGGKIQTVKSYPIIPYNFIEQKDHEVFSIFDGQNKPSVLANRKDLVIKSKLWDQRRCDDEEGWEEGSTGFSSSEEEDDEDNSLAELFSLDKNAIEIGKAKALQISSEQHAFEEGEEEEMLMQCRKDAARKGDLSPMHSKTNKKGRQRDRSWDGRVTEGGNIRRPPMRIAKLKQLTQRA